VPPGALGTPCYTTATEGIDMTRQQKRKIQHESTAPWASAGGGQNGHFPPEKWDLELINLKSAA